MGHFMGIGNQNNFEPSRVGPKTLFGFHFAKLINLDLVPVGFDQDEIKPVAG